MQGTFFQIILKYRRTTGLITAVCSALGIFVAIFLSLISIILAALVFLLSLLFGVCVEVFIWRVFANSLIGAPQTFLEGSSEMRNKTGFQLAKEAEQSASSEAEE